MITSPEPLSAQATSLGGPVVASQRWRDVAFLHWRVPADAVAGLLPSGVAPDEHDGPTWVGLIGFELDAATIGASPPIPHFGRFAEINVRLYAVDSTGRRGVVFRSLEASRLAAVLAARAAFSIPYRWSRTSIHRTGRSVAFRAQRHLGPGHSRFGVEWDPAAAHTGELELFLTACWGLFTERFGRTIYLPNEHEEWVVHQARLTHIDDELVGLAGVAVTGEPDSVLFSPGVTARFGRARPVPR